MRVGGGANYAFSTNKPNLLKFFPILKNPEFKRGLGHEKEVDLMVLSVASGMPGVKIYSICEHTPLNDYIPLAPVMNLSPMRAEEKPADAITDFLPMPKVLGGKAVRFFRLIDMEDEYMAFKQTIYGKILLWFLIVIKDTLISIKMLLRVMLKAWKIPFLKMRKENKSARD